MPGLKFTFCPTANLYSTIVPFYWLAISTKDVSELKGGTTPGNLRKRLFLHIGSKTRRIFDVTISSIDHRLYVVWHAILARASTAQRVAFLGERLLDVASGVQSAGASLDFLEQTPGEGAARQIFLIATSLPMESYTSKPSSSLPGWLFRIRRIWLSALAITSESFVKVVVSLSTTTRPCFQTILCCISASPSEKLGPSESRSRPSLDENITRQ
jgi:hypothetical protein